MFRIVCAKWGDLYTDDNVNSLYNEVKKNCSIDFTFEVFDKFPTHLDKYHEKHYRGHGAPSSPRDIIYNGYHRDDLGGIPHYRKILMFKMDEKFDRNDRILYLDLDSKIVGDLADFTILNSEKPYIIKNTWWEKDPSTWHRQYHITRCPLYNSSVLMWNRGQNRYIYNYLVKNADACFFTYPSMDTFMFHRFGPYIYGRRRKNHFNYFPEGMITSERVSEPHPWTKIHTLEGLSHNEKQNHIG
jgi:hypothetical protein